MALDPAQVHLINGPEDVRQPGDDEEINVIMDAYAFVEKTALKAEGLLYSFGASDVPNTLEGPPWPQVVHFASTQGVQMGVKSQGGAIAGYASSGERDLIYVTTMLVAGPATAQVDMFQLQIRTLRWLNLFKRCYLKNTTMAGTCREVTLLGARWGLLERFGGADWWGWYFFSTARAEYTYPRG